MRQMIFRKNYYLLLTMLEPEKRIEAYDAIMRYAFEGELVEVSPECKTVLTVIFDSIETDFKKYEQKMREKEEA